MKLCGYPMSCWPASWMILRKHPRESARVSTRGPGMAKEASCFFDVSSALLWPALFVWNRSGTPGPAVVKADVNICGVQCNMRQHSMSSSSGSSSTSEWARFCPHPICTHSGGHTAVHQRCTRLCARRCVCVCVHTQCVRRVVCAPQPWLGNI